MMVIVVVREEDQSSASGRTRWVVVVIFADRCTYLPWISRACRGAATVRVERMLADDQTVVRRFASTFLI